MEFEQVLEWVNEVLLAEKNRRLSDPETTILQGTWRGISYDEMAANSPYSTNYLMRDVGPNLWRSLSEILGEKVSKSNCRTVLESYQSSGEQGCNTAIASKTEKRKTPSASTRQTRYSWGEAPDISRFYGRVAELQTLDRWIRQEECRLVCLWGMGGMGKTALSRQFAEMIKDDFDYLFWRSLGDRPSIPDLCREILQLFDPKETQAKSSDRDILQILEYLQNHRCLLIFDDVEAILQGSDRPGGYARGYETYGQFFKRVGEIPHKSCLLLNSREKLKEIALLENSTEFAHSLELPGLTLEAATKLFEDKNLTGKKSWPDLLELYQGNPLALNLILITIQNFFNGDVAQYVKIKATYLPAEITNILHERFAQISALERGILTHLARASQSLSLLELIEQMRDLEFDDAIVAIESLQRRSLITAKHRDRETEFTLKAVVRKYLTKYYKTNGKQ